MSSLATAPHFDAPAGSQWPGSSAGQLINTARGSVGIHFLDFSATANERRRPEPSVLARDLYNDRITGSHYVPAFRKANRLDGGLHHDCFGDG